MTTQIPVPFGPNPFPRGRVPLSNVVPFTYRDGMTFLELLEETRSWINGTLIPELNGNVGDWTDLFSDRVVGVENRVIENETVFQETLNGFIADVESNMAVLNDSGFAGVVADPESKTAKAIDGFVDSTVAEKTAHLETLISDGIGDKVGKGDLFLNVKDFGAKGDGITDDTLPIREAIDAANLDGGTVFFPAGTYWIPRGGHMLHDYPGPSQFPRYVFKVKNNVSIIGQGATLTDDVDYESRRVLFYLQGSNIKIEGITTRSVYNMVNGSRPTQISIGMGDGFDNATLGHYENISILNCNFFRAWHPVKFNFNGGSGSTVKSITVQGCTNDGEPLSTSSGGYNFMCVPARRIQDVTVIGCKSRNMSVSANIGYYGVADGSITGNVCQGSKIDGAGIQTENGADNITITGNTLIDNFNHVWTDDSTNITISGNTMRNKDVNTAYKGVRITYQGYNEDPSKYVDNITATANILTNCFIAHEAFGTQWAGGTSLLGSVQFIGNIISLDGVTNNIGIQSGVCDSVIIANNKIMGAATISIRIAPRSGEVIVIEGNITRKRGNESSVGLDILNTLAVTPTVSNNRFDNGLPTTLTFVSTLVGSTQIISGTGEPGERIGATPGSLYMRRDASEATKSLYVKTGPGLLGWVAV